MSGRWKGFLQHPQLQDADAPLLFTFEGGAKYAPLALCGGLFALTILLSAIGPIDWNFDNSATVYGFLIACLAALVLGYVLATRRTQPAPSSGPVISASLIVVAGALLYLLLYPLTVQEATGRWYPDIWEGLVHSGQAYADKTRAADTLPQYAIYLGMLVAPLTIGVLPLTLFFFRRLSLLAKVLGVTVILLSLALGVAQATNKDVGEICGYVVLFLVLAAATGRGSLRERWQRIARCVVGAVLVCGLFFAYYSTVIHNRVATDVASSDGVDFGSTDQAMESTALHNFGTRRDDSLFYTVVPGPLQPGGIMLTSYLTQGYEGLSMAIDSPWHPTWGLGFSTFFQHNVSRVLGLNEQRLEARTYEGELDAKGWPAGAQWSTFFIHPASDITFPGVVFLMGVIGFAFGLSWRDTCTRRDPLACVVFFHLCMALFYLSANNQLYQGGRLAVGFTAVLIAWLALRGRRARPTARFTRPRSVSDVSERPQQTLPANPGPS